LPAFLCESGADKLTVFVRFQVLEFVQWDDADHKRRRFDGVSQRNRATGRRHQNTEARDEASRRRG
jgi:hypothetical protein